MPAERGCILQLNYSDCSACSIAHVSWCHMALQMTADLCFIRTLSREIDTAARTSRCRARLAVGSMRFGEHGLLADRCCIWNKASSIPKSPAGNPGALTGTLHLFLSVVAFFGSRQGRAPSHPLLPSQPGHGSGSILHCPLVVLEQHLSWKPPQTPTTPPKLQPSTLKEAGGVLEKKQNISKRLCFV